MGINSGGDSTSMLLGEPDWGAYRFYLPKERLRPDGKQLTDFGQEAGDRFANGVVFVCLAAIVTDML
ncbi:hypothetical protein [Bradyrhizobium sp. UFLA05-112]